MSPEISIGRRVGGLPDVDLGLNVLYPLEVPGIRMVFYEPRESVLMDEKYLRPQVFYIKGKTRSEFDIFPSSEGTLGRRLFPADSTKSNFWLTVFPDSKNFHFRTRVYLRWGGDSFAINEVASQFCGSLLGIQDGRIVDYSKSRAFHGTPIIFPSEVVLAPFFPRNGDVTGIIMIERRQLEQSIHDCTAFKNAFLNGAWAKEIFPARV